MLKRKYSWLMGLLLLLACWPMSASAADLSDPDARAVRAVVQAQLKAFAEGDAVRAFSYASPQIRSQFGDAAAFITMVQQGYPMVIRPAATVFSAPEAVDGNVLQVVQLRDADGRRWLATYQVQRGPDQRWRINGCAVVPDSGKSST